MKPSFAVISKYSSAMLALKGERWEYIMAFALAVGLALFLAISIIVNVYQLTQLIVASNRNISALAKYQQAVKADSTKARSFQIRQANLFQTSQVVTTTGSGQFYLVGVDYSSSNPRKSRVIIRNNSGEEGVYTIGEKLPEGAIVLNIGIDNVTLLHNGRFEQFTLDWEKIDSGNSGKEPEKSPIKIIIPYGNTLEPNLYHKVNDESYKQ